MTALPPIAGFIGSNVTEGEFKTALANLHLFLSGLLGTTGQAADAQAALGALLGAGAVTQTGAYTVQITDRGRVIACSGSFTVTLPDAAAVGSGFAVAIGNYGDGTITIDPFSTQTLDGAGTRTLSPNRMMVVCAINGEWLSVGGIGAASTSEAGVVRLVDSYASTSLTDAPTANALKAGIDAAMAPRTYSPGNNWVSPIQAALVVENTVNKEILNCRFIAGGTFRISLFLRSMSAFTIYAQIYKNGIALGIQRSTSSSTGVTFSEDLSFSPGDSLQVFAKTGSPDYLAEMTLRIGTSTKAMTPIAQLMIIGDR